MPNRKTTITGLAAFLALLAMGPHLGRAPLPEAQPTAEQVQSAVQQAELATASAIR